MFNLFEIMTSGATGAAMDDMARRFGIAPDEARKAMEALLPAFALGLQRSATNPTSFAELLGRLGSGRWTELFEPPASLFSPQAIRAGNDILTQLFGSEEASRRIAEQAAAFTGLPAQTLQQMLPAMAGLLMGGLSRSAISQGLADMFARLSEFWRGMAAAPTAPTAPAGAGAATPDPWAAWREIMARAGAAAPSPSGKGEPARPEASPFAAWTDMMAAMMGARASAPPAAASAGGKDVPPADAVAQMFQVGREVQAQHLTAMRNIIDSFWGAGPKA